MAHKVNLLFAELVGSAVLRGAAVRVTRPNEGRTWRRVMDAERIDYASIDV